MDAVTVEHLHVTIAVDDDEGDAAFARMFEKYMRRWREREHELEQDRTRAERDRVLPDRRGTAPT
jgi:hypothetical protein